MNAPAIKKDDILKRLDGNVGLFVLEQTGSTNDEARRLAEQGADATAVVSRSQTAGRGTKGRSFYCKKDEGLYLSYLFRPKQRINNFTALAAVAVAEAVRSVCGVDAKIKWVNDVVVDDKKLCGVLCESKTRPDGSPEYIIAGVGINTFVKEFPSELRDSAVSLHTLCQGFDPNELCAAVINGLRDMTAADDTSIVMRRYRELSSIVGREVCFTVAGGETRQGRAADIDADGVLIVESGGETVKLISSDVSVKPRR